MTTLKFENFHKFADSYNTQYQGVWCEFISKMTHAIQWQKFEKSCKLIFLYKIRTPESENFLVQRVI